MASRAEEVRRIPDVAEVRSILEKYFAGPITDAQVQAIDRRIHETAKSISKLHTESQVFYGNTVRAHGRAWKEELSYGQRAPRIVDLVPWFASTTNGFPPPRPYCPDPFVGEWEDIQTKLHWQFTADGGFSTGDTDLARHRMWCLVRKGGDTHAGDEIRLSDSDLGDSVPLRIKSITPTEVTLRRHGGGPVRAFELRRRR